MGDIPIYKLQEVFTITGMPQHTFVAPEEYPRLKLALDTPGRGIVVEGPTGIGKTTALQRAMNELQLENKTSWLSARKIEDVQYIKHLPSLRPFGMVVVDDFHRLDTTTKKIIADLMKVLADESDKKSKLIIVGINRAGDNLISFGHDLASRVEIIPFETNHNGKIEELVTKGEKCLNVKLNVKPEIIAAAQGSFFIAQKLAYETCIRADIIQTQNRLVETTVSFELIKAQIVKDLEVVYKKTAIQFARGTRLRKEGRAPYLHLLQWLIQCGHWYIQIDDEIKKHTSHRGSVSQVASKGFLAQLIKSSPEIASAIYYDEEVTILTVQDPQFMFYIRNMSWNEFVKDVGFSSVSFSSPYDFALSFAGTEREIAEAITEALQEREMEVFYDRNDQHRMLAVDIEEYLAPIYNSQAKFIICILSENYPQRIWTNFESKQFKNRFNIGEVIPVVVNDFGFSPFDKVGNIGHYHWDTSRDNKKQAAELVELLAMKIMEKR